MTRPNLPTLRSIAADAGVLRALPLDAIDALLIECDAENKIISAAKRHILASLDERYAAQIAGAYDAQQKDFGTVHVFAEGFDLEVNTPKKAEWDQAQLAVKANEIAAAGDDPTEYLDVIYAVPERKFTAWPAHIRAAFEPARTLKPGTRTFKLARAKQEAA
jgi:hypothetical protein